MQHQMEQQRYMQQLAAEEAKILKQERTFLADTFFFFRTAEL